MSGMKDERDLSEGDYGRAFILFKRNRKLNDLSSDILKSGLCFIILFSYETRLKRSRRDQETVN